MSESVDSSASGRMGKGMGQSDAKTGLKDVAREAGVSLGTASNVWRRPEIVAAATRERVLEAARRLGFHGPDPGATLLKTGRANCIGVVTDQPLDAFFTHRYTCRLMRGVAEGCAARGAGLSLVSGAIGVDGARWSVDTALVDGFVLYCLHDGSDLAERCARRGLPLVGIDHPPSASMATIRIDEHAAAAAVAHAALAAGHHRFGIVSLHTGLAPGTELARDTVAAVRYATTRRRLEGYLDVLEAAPSPVPVTLREAPLDADPDTRDELWNATARDLDGLDAVLAMSDDVARELVGRLPRRVRVFGFDGLDEDGGFATLVQPIEQKGRLAVEVIYAPTASRDQVLPVRFVEAMVARGRSG